MKATNQTTPRARRKREQPDLETRLARLERKTNRTAAQVLDLVLVVKSLGDLVDVVTRKQRLVNEALLRLGHAASERAAKALVIAADRSPQRPPNGAPLH